MPTASRGSRQLPTCVVPARPDPLFPPSRCHTSQPKLGGFCWNRQPEFSAYREAAFGHSLLTLLNATHAEFRWNRNDGHPNVINDYVSRRRAAAAGARGCSCKGAPAAGGRCQALGVGGGPPGGGPAKC
jgi:hypothetical protein